MTKTQPTLRVVSQNEPEQLREQLSKLYEDVLMIDSLASVLVDALAAKNKDPDLVHYSNTADIIRTQLKAVYLMLDDLASAMPVNPGK